jgi:hypothetical protein
LNDLGYIFELRISKGEFLYAPFEIGGIESNGIEARRMRDGFIMCGVISIPGQVGILCLF